MNTLSSILLILGGIAIIWYGSNMIRNHSAIFSKENLGKSLYTVGVLTLIIIGIILLCILMLRS